MSKVKAKPLVSVIIANFNGEKYLDAVLKSVLNSSYEKIEVVVVDDKSTDDSVEIISKYIKEDKRILLFKNEKNIGAAGSRNRALKFAKGEYLIFLDNDTEVQSSWVQGLLRELELSDVGAAQSLLLDFKDREIIQMAGGKLIPHVGWLAPYLHGIEYRKVKNKIKVNDIVAISAALAVKREVLKIVKGFDEKEALYTEDLDFCWRFWIAGYRVVLAKNSIVYHYTKSVTERAGMKASYKQIYYNLAKNSIRSILKNYSFVNVLKYLPFSILTNLGRGFLFIFIRHDFSSMLGGFYALLWNVYNFRDTIKERNYIQKIRKNKDEYLFNKIFIKDNYLTIYKKYFLPWIR